MISSDRAEGAVEYIRDNASEYARLVGLCKSLEQERKTVKGVQFLAAKGTVAEREATAYASIEFQMITEKIENAWADKTVIEIKIKAAEYTIDVWRSQNKGGPNI